MRRAVAAVLAAGALAALAVPPPAGAAVNTVVAGPGGAVPPAGPYYTPAVVAAKGQPLTFVNLDPTAPHNVQSVEAGPDAMPWCGDFGPGRCPLLWSRTIGPGTTPVLGLENAASPGLYTFFCVVHPWMRGMIVTV